MKRRGEIKMENEVETVLISEELPVPALEVAMPVEEVKPPHPLEGRFIRAEGCLTIWLVKDGVRRAFSSFPKLQAAFGILPPGGVLMVTPEVASAIPEGAPWA